MNTKPRRLLLAGAMLLASQAALRGAGAGEPADAPTRRPEMDRGAVRATTAPGADGASRATTPCDEGIPPSGPVAEFQERLLDLAFEAASSIPVHPHVKDRSRAQEAVVRACLELDQPQRGLGWIPRIADWRQGACYADLAFYCVEHACTENASNYLGLADRIAEGTEDWRRDRIRVKIARTYALLGRSAEAAQFEVGLVDSESGKVDRVRVRSIDESAFDDQLRALDEVVATGSFELTRNALWTGAELFDRFYGEAERRTMAEARIRSAWTKVPVMVRIDLLIELADAALRHGDQVKAALLATEASEMVRNHRWTAEYEVPLRARVAALMGRAGDIESARRENDAALALFDAGKDTIADVFRAEALRPVAEAYWTMGSRAEALVVYSRAVEAGAENPNSRPCAIDLSATCCSLAVNGVEPDAALWERLLQIVARLGDPW